MESRNRDKTEDARTGSVEKIEVVIKPTKKKKPKTCRFLTSACNIHTNSFVVVATKLNGDRDDSLDEFGRANKRTKIINPSTKTACPETTTSNETPKKRKKKKKSTAVRTISQLPSASMNTIIISPQDALSQIHCPIKLYKQIEVYVKPLLVPDVNGILCHRINQG